MNYFTSNPGKPMLLKDKPVKVMLKKHPNSKYWHDFLLIFNDDQMVKFLKIDNYAMEEFENALVNAAHIIHEYRMANEPRPKLNNHEHS